MTKKKAKWPNLFFKARQKKKKPSYLTSKKQIWQPWRKESCTFSFPKSVEKILQPETESLSRE